MSFSTKIPDVIKLLVAPLLTVFISTVLLFTVIGPVGRILSNGIQMQWYGERTTLGYSVMHCFTGIQQLVVITGLHHIIGAVEAQLITKYRNELYQSTDVGALMGQGGAVLGYLAVNWKNLKTEIVLFQVSFLRYFGISEPAIFGVNLRYR